MSTALAAFLIGMWLGGVLIAAAVGAGHALSKTVSPSTRSTESSK